MKILSIALLLLAPICSLEQTQQLSSKTLTFSDADFANVVGTVENVTAEPKIITQRFAAEPRIITERTIGEPRIVEENYVEPLRQRVVVAPSIKQKVEYLIPDYRQEMDTFQTNTSTLPVQTRFESKPKTVTVDGDTKYFQTIVEPTLKKVTEKLRVVEGGERVETLEPIIKPA